MARCLYLLSACLALAACEKITPGPPDPTETLAEPIDGLTPEQTALHLRGAVKPWFFQWLAREHPELVPKYRAMYPGASAYAPAEYREWLAGRIRPLIRAHRLERGRENSVTGGVRSSALGRGTRTTTVGERAARAAASELGPVDLGAAAPAMLF